MNKNIQERVLKLIREAKQYGLVYISQKQIVAELEKEYPKEKNWNQKVGQALYQLQQKKELRDPLIRKYFEGERVVGYTINEEDIDL